MRDATHPLRQGLRPTNSEKGEGESTEGQNRKICKFVCPSGSDPLQQKNINILMELSASFVPLMPFSRHCMSCYACTSRDVLVYGDRDIFSPQKD